MIFPVAEQDVLRLLEEDAVVADVAGGHHGQHVGPHRGMQALVFIDLGCASSRMHMPTSGSIHIGARDVTRVPPQARDIAMVFQNYALFHLD